MKNTNTQNWIQELQEGQLIENKYCYVKEANKSTTKTGKPYVNLKLADSTGEIDGKIWDNVGDLEKECQVGSVIRISGSTQKFRNSLQLVVENAKRAENSDIRIIDFLPRTNKNIEGMFKELVKIIEGLDDLHIRELLLTILMDKIISEKFKYAPAAKNIHHAYIGGLLEHTLNICNIASMVADYYAPTINRSLLLAGAILHDIGKIEEFNTPGNSDDLLQGVNPFEYSDAGRLLGHMVLAISMVDEHISSVHNFPKKTELKIKHMILSHHGKHEFGAPTLPMFLEAFILHFIDDMDAKVNYIEKLNTDRARNDEMKWSEYQRMLERFILLPENKTPHESSRNKPVAPEEQKEISEEQDHPTLF